MRTQAQLLASGVALVVALLLFSRCGTLQKEDDEKAAGTKTKTPDGAACAVTPSASKVSAGSAVDLGVASDFDWSKAESVTVDGDLVLTKAEPRQQVQVTATRKFVAVTKSKDGSESSCEVEVTVEGSAASSLSCTLAASPTKAPAGGGPVTITLAVVGSGGADKATINGAEIAKVGGATTVTVTAKKSFVGKVTKGAASETCSLDVDVATATTTTEPVPGTPCKQAPETGDYQTLQAKQEAHDVENATARTAALDAALSSSSLTLIEEIKPIVIGYEGGVEKICAKLAEADATEKTCGLAAGTSLGEEDANGFRWLALERGGEKLVVVEWSRRRSEDEVLAAKTAGAPRALFMQKNSTQGDEVPINHCACDDSFDEKSASSGIAADIASPQISALIIPVATFPAPGTVLILNAPYDVKQARFKYIEVDPPAGQAKPKCPMSPEAAT